MVHEVNIKRIYMLNKLHVFHYIHNILFRPLVREENELNIEKLGSNKALDGWVNKHQ
jgi:hypothetical protein